MPRPRKPRVYPRHGKAFAKPIRLNPLGRRQVGITPRIKAYVAGFKARNLKGLDLAKAIVEDIATFKEIEVTHQQAQALWAKRSANEIISTRQIVTAKYTKEALGKHRNIIMGCTDQVQAVVAALRAAGFQALVARELLHTDVKMLYKDRGRWKVFIIDLAEEKRNKFREMTAADKRREESCKRQGSFAEGTSLAQIGIKSYADFFKYGPKHLR